MKILLILILFICIVGVIQLMNPLDLSDNISKPYTREVIIPYTTDYIENLSQEEYQSLLHKRGLSG